MKYTIIAIFTVLMLGFNTEAQAQKNGDRDQFEIQVDGLGCPFCAYGLEKKFKEFKGLKNVKIEMETGLFSFTFPAEERLTIERITTQVEKAGYTPVSAKVTRVDGTVETSDQKEVSLEDYAEVGEASLFVAGNCGMCRARIEKTAKNTEGVLLATWDEDTKMLDLKFDASAAKTADIEAAVAQAIATSGHDTKTAKADDKVYKGLPGCCKYKRVK